MWRLVLHRIDIRNFAVSGTTEDGLTIIQASEPAADVQAVVESHRPRSEAQMQRMNLLAWGIAVSGEIPIPLRTQVSGQRNSPKLRNA